VDVLKFNVLLSPDQADRSSIPDANCRRARREDLAVLSLQQHLDLSVTTDDGHFSSTSLNALDPASIQLALSISKALFVAISGNGDASDHRRILRPAVCLR